jgi:DNA-binding transcriptional LysR family regulator
VVADRWRTPVTSRASSPTAGSSSARLLTAYELGGAALWAVYPSTHHSSPKVRAFVDFLAERTKKALSA